jgi:hypothetical protein
MTVLSKVYIQGLGEACVLLDTSVKILVPSIGLHLYLIFSFRTYIVILVVCFTFSNLVYREPRLHNSFTVEIATHLVK